MEGKQILKTRKPSLSFPAEIKNPPGDFPCPENRPLFFRSGNPDNTDTTIKCFGVADRSAMNNYCEIN